MDNKPTCTDGAGAHPSDFVRKAITAVAIGIGAILGALFLWYATEVLLLAFAGILIAIFLQTLSGWVQRLTRLPHGFALALTLLILAGLAVLVFYLTAPRISGQVDQLMEKLPQSVEALKARIARYGWVEDVISSGFGAETLMPDLNVFKRTTGVVSRTFNVLFSIVVVAFVAIYVAAEPSLYLRGIMHMVPCGWRDKTGELFTALGEALRRWLLATLVAMCVTGVLTWLGLVWLGVPLAMLLALLAALLNFIPNFGPLLALAPAALLALLQSPALAGYVILLYSGVQLIESYLVTPLAQRKAVSLPPVVLILGQVLMGILAGPMGLILATPLLVVAMVTLQMLYVREALGDQVKVSGQGEG